MTVTVTHVVALPALEWIRVDGRLHFSSVDSSQLSVSTVLVTPAGTLSIGTPERPVDPEKTVRLVFAGRPSTVRQQDSFDILGGVIALGRVEIYGAPKAGFATPSNALEPAVSRLTFSTPPTGWRAGDELLFPAPDVASEEEQRRIASISDDGTTMTLSAPLKFGHRPPAGMGAEVPIGNLTRNVILASADTRALNQRAHVMVMTHEPLHISGASFAGLGRTTATRPHTLPTMNNGQLSPGENPIGRYAVHFHMVSGASRRHSPHVFSGNVIVDSPKHGLVNHGGYVVAENNVTFGIHGSHFFAENGSEIGTFRHNLAVFSRGSGEPIEGRLTGIGDFGHGGHGFWSNSPALVMEGNYAFDHSGPAYVIFAAPIEEAGGKQNVFVGERKSIANVLEENLDSPLREMVTEKQVTPTTIPFRFSRNAAANSGRGLEVWHTNELSAHNLESLVEDCMFWNVRSGIDITYGVNTVVRNSILLGYGSERCDEGSCDENIGITTEGTTRNLRVDGVHISGFRTGIWIPSRGTTQISRTRFDNTFNLLMYPPHQPGRRTIVADNRFAPHRDGGEDYHFVQSRVLFHGDVSMLFERDPLIVTDDRFPGRYIYRRSQHPAAIPFREWGIPELDGKTADQLRREYGLAIGGVLAPVDATHIAGIADLVGGPPVDAAEMADEERMLARTGRLQSGRGESYTSNDEEGYGTDCCNIHRLIKGKAGERTGWRFLTEREGHRIVTRLTYVDTQPPQFELDPSMPLEIHPDDVKYGVLIQGSLYDEGVPPEMVRRTYDTLTVDREGYVNIPFEYPDRAGNVVRHLYRLKVTPRAAKRGSDLSYYLHRPSRFATARKFVGDAFRGVLLRTSAMVRAWMPRPARV